MADIFGSRSRMRATLSVVLAFALGACSLTPERPAELDPVHENATTQLDALLASLHAFIAASPEQRTAIYFDALAAERTPGNRLRLALLQGWPDHAHSRPADALRLADQVMDDETLDGDVRDLARVLRFWIASHQVDQRRERDLRGRIAELEARIDALQRQLQALTEIERAVEPGP